MILITVIITTHNRSDLLLRAVYSVLRQTYTNIECIIVDDASTDNTKEVISCIEDPRVIYIRHETNRHLSAARNTGIENAKGDYIAFLDDDDEWLPEKLEKQIGLIERLPNEVGLVYCWMAYFDGQKIVSERCPSLRGSIFESTIDSQPIGNGSTWLLRREVFKNIGGFNENIKRGVDGDFIRQLTLKYKVDFLPEILVSYYVGHERITTQNRASINNAINAYLTWLDKFNTVLSSYPHKTANLHATIAYHYAMLGEWKNCVKHFRLAANLSPMNTFIYLKALKSIKFLYRSKRAL